MPSDDLTTVPATPASAPPPAAPVTPPEAATPPAPPAGLKGLFQSVRETLAARATAPAAAPAETPAEGEEVPAETPAGEGEVPAEGEETPPEGEETPAPPITFRLPAITEGQEGPEIEVSDPAIQEHLTTLAARASRVAEIASRESAMERQGEELAYIEARIQTDPIGFVLDVMPADTHLEMALHILAREGMLAQAQDKISEWMQDDTLRKTDALELHNQRLLAQRDHETATQVRLMAGRNVRVATKTVDTLAGLVADDLRDSFRDDLLRDIQEWGRANDQMLGTRALTPEAVLRVVERRLRIYGQDPVRAQALLDPNVPLPPTPAAPANDAARRMAQTAAAARETGKRFVKAASQRQAAGTVPAPGPSGLPPGPELKKTDRVEDRIKALRERLAHR